MKRFFKSIAGKFLFYVLFLMPLAIFIEIPIFLAGVGLGTYLVFSRNLPQIPAMVSYQPKTVSTFYADDGTVIGVFTHERRYVVELAQIPPHVVKAFLAAEDSRFFEHNGIDWIRIVAAGVRNLRERKISSGGSTITMQVTRKFMLTSERKFSRKIKEMILAPKLEKTWGKNKILHVYLNEIFLGQGCYGVEAAARGYFDKPVEHLTVAEAAMITGLIASPSQYNPFKSPELARHRQVVVLDRMLRFGFITKEEYEKAKNEKLNLKREVVQPLDLAPDFTEVVRRYIVKKYGEEKLYNEGLKVFTTCKIDYQRNAVEAVDKGVGEVKARMKNPALLRTVPKEEIAELLQKRSTPDLQENKPYQGVVVKLTPSKNKGVTLDVALSKRVVGQVHLDHSGAVYKVGSVLALRFEKFIGETPVFVLDTDAKPQAAFVCIENRTGFVRALVGGTSGDRFKFNRATQARRQPGSSFKPIIYSVALEERSYSPATIIVDEPIVVDFDKDDVGWEPRNAGGDYLGPLSLRRALELSRNICTIKILMDVGFDPVIEMAHKMGVTAELGRNLSLSLGTSELSLIELVSAYTVFPNSGIHVSPVLIKKIEDRFGNILEDNTNVPLLDESEIPTPTPREEFAEEFTEQQAVRQVTNVSSAKGKQNISRTAAAHNKPKVHDKNADGADNGDVVQANGRVTAAMSPQTAYIMTSLLHGIVTSGTGSRLRKYVDRKDLAGKTGTTNKAADTWFIGFNPDYTAGAWVGFDEKRPLGGREEGARAALPIWGYFMNEILANKPQRDFPVPPEVTFKDMLTFAGSPSQGFSPRMVREPVYTPFVGKTLVLSPIDPPQTLTQYRGIVLPGTTPDQAPGVVPSGQPAPLYPGQAPTPPLNPMDGRNLFPDITSPAPAPPRPAPRPQENTMPQPGRQPGMSPAVGGPQSAPYGQTAPGQDTRRRQAPPQPPTAPR